MQFDHIRLDERSSLVKGAAFLPTGGLPVGSRRSRLSFLSGMLLVTVLLSSCKKTDHYAQLVNDQPFIVTGELGLYSIGLGSYPGYQSSYLVGDTATFIGKFFLNRPGSRIQVGNDTAHILFSRQVPNGTNEYTHQTDQLDYVRFLITKNMGLGNSIHVTITANGVTLHAPDISIRQFQGILRRTDTTLYVDSITTWFPPDVSYYQANYLQLINYATIAGDGTVCFNNLTGIYNLKNGQVTQWLKTGAQLQENGTSFTIGAILGSALSFGGDVLNFSAEVRENTPDTATAYIFRLCKLNLASGQVTTINRTEVQKDTAAVNEAPGPYEGAISTLHIVATDLRTDANGAIYFINDYAPARTDYSAAIYWHWALTTGNALSGDNNAYQNICRADANGHVKSLLSQHNPFFGPPMYTIPGYPVATTQDYLVSLDGSTGYAMDQLSMLSNSLGYFDFTQDALLISTGVNPPAYRFFSYDTSHVTGLQSTLFNPYFGANVNQMLSNFLILPDGDLLCEGTASLAAVSLQNKSLYCYAGTEMGLGTPPAVQSQSTGWAKYVLFWNSNLYLAGVDKLDNIYYYNMGSQYAADTYTTGVSFFKLYSKK